MILMTWEVLKCTSHNHLEASATPSEPFTLVTHGKYLGNTTL